MTNRLRQLFDAIMEILESLGLLICLLLSAPLRFFRGFDRVYACFYYVQVLVPRGLFAPMLRAHFEDKMGNHQQSANVLDQVAYILEEVESVERQPNVSRMLCDIYCLLFKQYVLAGNLEEATLTVIRAHQSTGLDRLPTTPGFDVRVAHVVKAGIAAGKLLEDGGLATLMVRQGDEPIVSKPTNKRDLKVRKAQKPKEGATIIPFPSPVQ
ncbi:hypothetical protein [Pseudobacteriovorax antillogorgiicola]|uniref:Uncharacterized protein n=1 Tax=Pseudobacteriovorax antillogorgiicola TaxID=1513793 RepID=A0A1Y6B5Y5_9BACT|nr:hypothetical protein [Pseudobacteriovorax antillogorgiicola]TCS58859.1 hypothetical protein EDD56_102374 [Pseudobacteriovorax antillogorgiicola]SME93964.1 hypothetical protein SAMN06296036_10269 [Pseudobacteriovorax antillogorgiicola]